MPPRAKKTAVRTPHRAVYTAALGERICAAAADGSTLTEQARALGIGRHVLSRWLKAHPAFREAYEQARAERLDAMEDRLIEIPQLAHAAAHAENAAPLIRACELEAHALQWQLVKLYPERYGDKSKLELTGKDGAALMPSHTAEEDAAFAAMLAAVQAKTPPPAPEP